MVVWRSEVASGGVGSEVEASGGVGSEVEASGSGGGWGGG